MNILEYEFMQRAFIVGILLSIAIPSIGIYIVIKRLSMIGDALSHTSLAGVATGLILGINPVLGAVSITILAALSIEFIRKRIPRFSELSIAIIMSTGIGLAGVLSGFVKNSVNFNSFLFGSIVAISDTELYTILFVTFLILGVLLVFRKGIFYILMDEQGARLAGVPVRLINFSITVLTALTVSVASRTV
ncbi:MAG: metal ABC transporter permease, partial [Vallitaleaceae bacterium]|nr:metal ABC transporter permease [Vallitaleaceae bacterium]